MNHQRGAVVEVKEQVFGAAADGRDFPSDDPRGNCLDLLLPHNAGEGGRAQSHNGPADDERGKGAADGLDFGKFWHTSSGTLQQGSRIAVDRTTSGRDAGDGEATGDCVFCRIARGELGVEFLAASEHAVAFRDLNPQAPTHVLVVPRRHVSALRALSADDAALAADLLGLANTVARQEGLLEGGYRVLTNDGPDAGQTVFHLHFHVLGGRPMASALA